MKPRVLAIRAIGVQYAKRAIYPTIGYIGLGGGIAIIAIGLLAHYFSSWWWLVAIPVVFVVAATIVIWLILRLVLNRLQPPLAATQAEATKLFVEKTERLLENSSTPYPILAFRVVIDTVFKRKKGLIDEVISDSRGLRTEFSKVVKEFEI